MTHALCSMVFAVLVTAHQPHRLQHRPSQDTAQYAAVTAESSAGGAVADEEPPRSAAPGSVESDSEAPPAPWRSAPGAFKVHSGDGVSLAFTSSGAVAAAAVAGKRVGSARSLAGPGASPRAGFSLLPHEHSPSATWPSGSPDKGARHGQISRQQRQNAGYRGRGMNVLKNGDFSKPADGPPFAPGQYLTSAAGWAAVETDGRYDGLGYVRTTDPAKIRAHHAAAAVVSNKANTTSGYGGPQAGLSQRWVPQSAEQALAHQLLLSGWSMTMSDSRPVGEKDADYCIFADISYTDGTYLYGQKASFQAGVHDWAYAATTIHLTKPVRHVNVFALFRNRLGVAAFSDLYLGVAAGPIPFYGNVSVAPNGSLLVVASATPSGWHKSINLSAVFTGKSDHIRCDGSISLSPRDGESLSSESDAAVTLQFSVPVDGRGFTAHIDGYAKQSIRNSTDIYAGDRFALVPDGNDASRRPGEETGLTISKYPFFVISDPLEKLVLMIAIPTENTVYVHRTQFNAETSTLDVFFDFGLSVVPQRFFVSASFSFMIASAKTVELADSFRSGLQRYYDMHPGVWGHNSQLHDQGAWLPFISDLHEIAGWRDFGFKYEEGGGGLNVTNSRFMNAHGTWSLPYIEPHLIGFPLPHNMQPTYDNVNRTIHECVRHPELYGGLNCSAPCLANNKSLNCDYRQRHDEVLPPWGYFTSGGVACGAVVCRQILSDAARDADGRWIFDIENTPWNQGVLFYPDVTPTVSLRAEQQLQIVQGYYQQSIQGNYSINGIYVDSTIAGFSLLNYDLRTMRNTKHPLVFNAQGRPAVLFVQTLFTFFQAVDKIIHPHNQVLMGNGINTYYGSFGMPAVFDIAGTEDNWQSSAGLFKPPARANLLMRRALSGSGPYLILMNTNLDLWTKNMTQQYIEICLSFGFWPSFFYDSGHANYFHNATLYNRDRPIFRLFVPLLHEINLAGWQPLTLASVTTPSSNSQSEVYVERFGSVEGENGKVFFTVRNEGFGIVRGQKLLLNAEALGVTVGNHSVLELTRGDLWNSTLRVVSSSQRTASVQLPSLPPNTTLLFQVVVDTHAVVAAAATVPVTTAPATARGFPGAHNSRHESLKSDNGIVATTNLKWLSWYTFTGRSFVAAGRALDDAHTTLFLERNVSNLHEGRPSIYFLDRELWNETVMEENKHLRERFQPSHGNEGSTVLPRNWRAKIASIAQKLERRAGVRGIMLGDELICRGVPLVNFSAVAAELRRHVQREVWLWSNECESAHKFGRWWPAALDVVSIDLYDYKHPANEASTVQQYYEQYIFPLLGLNQKVAVVPGLFSTDSASSNRTAQDLGLCDKLSGYQAWAGADRRIVGMASFHWDTFNNHTGSPPALFRRGAEGYPRLLARVAQLRRTIGTLATY